MKVLTTTITDGRLDSSSRSPNTAVTFPTNIHLDLLRTGSIPDPHLGFNERAVQWVHEENSWTYSASFYIGPNISQRGSAEGLRLALMPHNNRVSLIFEGLDTFATVYVNGYKCLESDNMFLSHRVDITDIARTGGPHNLRIEFKSALQEGDTIMAQNGGERVTWNGHYSRVFVRKAQYHYGWDWGPSLITCGPWKPIYLQVYTDRIFSTNVVKTLTPDLKKATLHFFVTIDTRNERKGVYFVSALLLSPSGKEIRLSLYRGTNSDVWKTTREIENPELWYPKQHGPQSLYTVIFTLTTSSVSSVQNSPSYRDFDPYEDDDQGRRSPVLDTVTSRFGIRRVRVVQDPVPLDPSNPVSGGKTFYFEVNNTPIFIGGSNWIPAHSFLPVVSRETLKTLLKTLLLERGNQNMVRVWGGGVYESDDFYEICDEEGILVWQDICLACGDYPANLDLFVESVSEEVRQNLGRLRRHPSLVIVAGNNEDYQVADEALGYDQNQPKEEWRGSKFPGRWLYEKVFPEIIRDECNGGFGEGIGDAGEEGGSAGIMYWPGSPWGGEDSTDRTIGDIHQWNIWGGTQAPYQRYPDLGGRFVSEFGMISYPSVQTIKKGFLDPTVSFEESKNGGDWNPESEIVEHHMKAHSFEKRFIAYLAENFRVMDGTMEERVYLSQLLQSEAMGYAYRGWRKRWGNRECGGALVWQLNDVWPATSWSIIDFHLQPKPAFYIISRALAPITLILTRTTNNPKPNSNVEALVRSKTTKGAGKLPLHSTPHIYPPKTSTIQVCVSSILPARSRIFKAEIRFVSINTGRSQTVWQGEVDVPENSVVILLNGVAVPEDEATVVQALLWDNDTCELLARETDWPQPFKYYTFPDRGLKLKWEFDKEESEVRITTKKPVKGLAFEEIEGVVWSDNCLDVVPGDEQVIKLKGIEGKKITWRFYGMQGTGSVVWASLPPSPLQSSQPPYRATA